MKSLKTLLVSASVLATLATTAVMADEQDNTEVKPVEPVQSQTEVHESELPTQTQSQPVAQATEQAQTDAQAETTQSQPVTQANETQPTEQTTQATEPQVQTQQTTTEQSKNVGNVDSVTYSQERPGKISTYENIKGEVKFHVEDNTAKENDTTEITLPEQLRLRNAGNEVINLKNDYGIHFADATLYGQTNKIVVKYNKNVENLVGIEGGFNFVANLNTDKIKELGKLNLVTKVNHNTVINQRELEYDGVGYKRSDREFLKSSWQANDGNIWTEIRIKQGKGSFSNQVITDTIAEHSRDNATYNYKTMKVTIGNWTWTDKYGWQLWDEQDITDQVKFSKKNEYTFTMILPEIANNKGVRVTYLSDYISKVDKDETVDNAAELFQGENKVTEYVSYAYMFSLSGWIKGNTKPIPVKPIEPAPKPEPKPEPKKDEPKKDTPRNKEDKPQPKEEPKSNTGIPVDSRKAEVKAHVKKQQEVGLPVTGDKLDNFIAVGILLIVLGIAGFVESKIDE